MKKLTGIEFLSIMLLAILAAFILVLVKADAALFDLPSRMAEKKGGAIACGRTAASEKTGSESRTKKKIRIKILAATAVRTRWRLHYVTHTNPNARIRNKMFHHKKNKKQLPRPNEWPLLITLKYNSNG